MNGGKKILGILGGMGPLATIDLQQRILDFTDAETDQEHIRVFVDNHPQIPDRISAILADGESPVPALLESLLALTSCGAECIVMPCVTAHYFLPRLRVPEGVEFLNMLGIAVNACLARYPGKTAGVLSSTATAKSALVTDMLGKMNIPFVAPLDEDQRLLGRLILNVKARADMEEAGRRFNAVAEEMSSRGADYFLLACTELPIIARASAFPYGFIDATSELAKAAVKACGYPCRG